MTDRRCEDYVNISREEHERLTGLARMAVDTAALVGVARATAHDWDDLSRLERWAITRLQPRLASCLNVLLAQTRRDL